MALNRMLGNFNRKLGNFYRKSENFNRKLEETGKNGLEFYLNFILMRFHQLIWTTSKQNVCVMRSQTVYNRKKSTIMLSWGVRIRDVLDNGILPDTGILPDAGILPDTEILPDIGILLDTGTLPQSLTAPPISCPHCGLVSNMSKASQYVLSS